MTDRRLRLRLGLFVAGTLLGLSGLVVLFGGAPDIFSNRAKYGVLFPEAPGMAPGIPIRKSGVRIGEVTGVELDPGTGQVRVNIAVDRKYLPRQNEEATITRGILNGDTAIDFLPKLREDGQLLPRGDEYPPGSDIVGVPPITPRSLLTPASGVLATAQGQLERLVKSFEKLEKIAPKVESAADEISLLARDVRQFIPELKKTNDAIRGLIGESPPKEVPIGVGPPLQPPGAEDPTLKALIRDIQELTRAVKPAAEDIRAGIKRLEPELTAAVKSARTTFEGVSEVLSPENRKLMVELLKNINSLGFTILKLAGGLGTLLDDADKMVKNLDARVTEAGGVIADVRGLTKPLTDQSGTIVRDVTEAAGQLAKGIAEIRELVRVFGRENGSIQKLITDPALFNNLDAAAVSLARVLARAEKIARDLEVFADKVARRPELIGVGGVLKPSSGLKDAPTAAGLPCYRPDWPPATSARPPTGPAWLQPQPQPQPPPPVQGFPPRE